MKIIIAQHAGFCFGVRRAIQAVNENLPSTGRIYTLGPIIHNPQVVEQLKNKGVVIEEDVEHLPEEGTVIIRSHGVPEKTIQAIKEKKIKIVDATCPYVKRIHELVKKYDQRDYSIIIIGEKDHPEVIGINGWCYHKGYIVYEDDDLNQLPTIYKACVVAQTTIDKAKCNHMIQLLSERIKELKIFQTICYATSKRQQEAKMIAIQSDIMYVIGGSNSSNTSKLFAVCKSFCRRTYAIETVKDINLSTIKSDDVIGITAGASTPDWIIEEVITKMNELQGELQEKEMDQDITTDEKIIENDQSEEKEEDEMTTMEGYEETMVSLRPGQIVTGQILRVSHNEMFVNVGYKSDGIIPIDEVIMEEGQRLTDVFKEDDRIEVEILKVNDGEGNVLLSQKAVAKKKGWKDIEEAFKNGTELAGICTEVVKGGVLARIKGTPAFVPASQLTSHYVNDLSSFVGKTLRLKILELDKERNRVLASQRIILESLEKEKQQNVWGVIQEGQKIQGEVRRLTNFGAFVDIGGVDGLIHISDLSWSHIKLPQEVVSVGQKVEVVVLSLDREKQRISLGYKQTMPHPWENIESKYPVGEIVEGKVARITNFGAFVTLESGVDGLVHISQISHERINKVEDVLKPGNSVTVKILEVKAQEKRISLSIKEVNPKEETLAPEKENEYVQPEEEMNVSLGDLFPKNTN